MKLTKRHWIILAVVAALAVGAYFYWRYRKMQAEQEGQNPQGLGSNLNSPAPQMNAAPSVAPSGGSGHLGGGQPSSPAILGITRT